MKEEKIVKGNLEWNELDDTNVSFVEDENGKFTVITKEETALEYQKSLEQNAYRRGIVFSDGTHECAMMPMFFTEDFAGFIHSLSDGDKIMIAKEMLKVTLIYLGGLDKTVKSVEVKFY